jgi:hypothetical protein
MVKIEDVTTQILEGTATLANEPTNRKNSRKHHSIERLFPERILARKQNCTFYEAINTYFCNRNFSDVRLVGLRLHQ